MKLSSVELCDDTEKLFRILSNLRKDNLRLISLGNSIATGFSFCDENMPLFDRNKAFEHYADKYWIDLEKYNFCRSENNSDEHILNWIINNVSESEMNLENRRDYYNHINCEHGLMTEEEIDEYFPLNPSRDKKIQDVMFSKDKLDATITVLNCATGSFLDNITRRGKHKLTGGIKKDLGYTESILGYVQNYNRENDTNTQIYLCGAPKVPIIHASDCFINRPLKQISKRYANVSYVPNFKRKAVYNEGKAKFDIHYNTEEYKYLIDQIIKSIIKNYQFREYLIDIDRKLFKLNKEVELKMLKRSTKDDILSIIEEYSKKLKENQEEFLILVRNYLLERYPYDFAFLDYDAIDEDIKKLSYKE